MKGILHDMLEVVTQEKEQPIPDTTKKKKSTKCNLIFQDIFQYACRAASLSVNKSSFDIK